MEWTRGPVLGRGSAATVSAATSTSGDVFAVKSVDFRQAESLLKEQHFLSILDSPYVVSYKGCDTTIEDNKSLYNIFIDYMSGGSITDLIKRRNGKGLTDSEIVNYTRQIVQGLEYIHSKGIVHCDVKGGNILINEKGAKISDFGCAKWASVNKLARLAQNPISGTPMYMSPETARGEDQGFPADVWAVGCTVIEMTGRSPWPDAKDPVSVLYKIAFSEEIPTIPDELSDQAKDFISKCLIRDPKQRWTASELLKHPYIQNQESCEKLRTDSPTSVFDQDVWDSMNETSSTTTSYASWVGVEFGQIDCLCFSNSLRQRIEQLADKSEMPKWRCEKGETEWIMVRMSGGCGEK